MFRTLPFREDRPEIMHALIRTHPLATLVTQGTSGLNASLLPFSLVIEDERPDRLRAHIARANDQLADLRDGAEALVIFQGPQAYITPNWYPTKAEHGKAVPTWNYIVVQARGVPQLIQDADWLRDQIDALTAHQESGQPAPWTVEEAPAAYIDAMIKAIIGIEIPIERIEGKWKVSQNQPAVNRAGVVAGLRAIDAGSAMADAVDRGR
jgi:transcriptional regulator